MRILIAALAAAALLTVPATAGSVSQHGAAPNKKICKRATKTGSLVSRRSACLTQAEWNEVAEMNRRDAERFAARTLVRPDLFGSPAVAPAPAPAPSSAPY